MARIRTIKPEFWSDDAVTDCSLSTRLLFIGMWNFADDMGNIDRSAKQIKARVFPHDQVDCEAMIAELLASKLIVEYCVEGRCFLHIRNFSKHQVINRPSNPTCPEYSESAVVITDHSVSTHSGKGREGKGREKEHETPLASHDKIVFDMLTGEFSGINGQMQVWQRAYPAVTIDVEIAKAAAWLIANPKNQKSNYSRFLASWLSRAQDKAPRLSTEPDYSGLRD